MIGPDGAGGTITTGGAAAVVSDVIANTHALNTHNFALLHEHERA